ncbi:hypothetical protein T09_4416 [Trichinella sp. T9]|nr:hypothetical protein T09_4416 [Trichinella sp. T9]
MYQPRSVISFLEGADEISRGACGLVTLLLVVHMTTLHTSVYQLKFSLERASSSLDMLSRILRSKKIITKLLIRACIIDRQNEDSNLERVLTVASEIGEDMPTVNAD